MNQQGTHRHHSSLGDQTLDWGDSGTEFSDFVVAQNTTIMRSWEDAQWPILIARIIKMNSQSQHLSKH
jgi:hypothetical protein